MVPRSYWAYQMYPSALVSSLFKVHILAKVGVGVIVPRNYICGLPDMSIGSMYLRLACLER